MVIHLNSYPSLYIAVANSRYSDQIVVYVYQNTKHPSNLPDEKSWENAGHFPEESSREAAQYVAGEIRKFLKEKKCRVTG